MNLGAVNPPPTPPVGMTVGQLIAMVVMGLFIIVAFLVYLRNKH